MKRKIPQDFRRDKAIAEQVLMNRKIIGECTDNFVIFLCLTDAYRNW